MNKPLKKPATSILRAELQRIFKKHGKLDAEIVLREATPKSSVLHGEFEWGDHDAAHAYRLLQAGELITRVKIIVRPIPSVELSVPEMFSSSKNRREGGGFTPRAQVSIPDVRETACEEITGWRVRYFNLLDMCGQGGRLKKAEALFAQLEKLLE